MLSIALRRIQGDRVVLGSADFNELVQRAKKVEEVVFAYSDVPHQYVMNRASAVLAAGADFKLIGMNDAAIPSTKPVVSICAGRTGSGKSQTTRRVADILRGMGAKLAVARHPMPYGDLAKQAVQRFKTLADMDKHKCTIEEREEYEPHIMNDMVVYAGVDYEAILRKMETEADIVLWDGGNNDLPFFRPDLSIVVVDPHRPGHEVTYHPGDTNVRAADVIVINKIDTADLDDIEDVRENISIVNPDAVVIDAASPLTANNPEIIRGKSVLVVEDGPTLTHGEMEYGAGTVIARRYGAAELIDPRDFAVGSIRGVFEKYPEIGTLLPAMGYGTKQVRDLERTIKASGADVVVIGTPIDLSKLIKIPMPTVRVEYSLQEIGKPDLTDVLAAFWKKHSKKSAKRGKKK